MQNYGMTKHVRIIRDTGPYIRVVQVVQGWQLIRDNTIQHNLLDQCGFRGSWRPLGPDPG